MFDARGSVWRKWDLHVHTPASHVNGYGGDDAWDRFLNDLEALPPEFKVIGINDYIFLDGYRRVLKERAKGRLKNLDLVLPVIELRLDKFGGSGTQLSKVNFHAIFSDQLDPAVIEVQFLQGLATNYILSPEHDALRASGKWCMTATRESLAQLGKLIIDSVPDDKKADYGSPAIEGFNNLCYNLAHIQKVLARPHFEGHVLTAVGKTEWADVKWNDNTIAEKKTVINGVDAVFISEENPAAWKTAQEHLSTSGVRAELLDCSDAHNFSDSPEKDRIGNCFTWIKSDPTFEGLRQALYEFPTRVCVQKDPPRQPPIQMRRAIINLPADTQISGKTSPEPFCFRGNSEIVFSPYLTCLIGGRGSGKSTILNILNERLQKGSTKFFEENSLTNNGELSLDDHVQFEGTFEASEVEFLEQNEIEQFASDADRFTEAVFARLRKLDREKALNSVEAKVDSAMTSVAEQKRRTIELHSLLRQIAAHESERTAKQALIESFQDDEYKAISDSLGKKLNELQGLMNSRQLLEAFLEEIEGLIARTALLAGVPGNAYGIALNGISGSSRQDCRRCKVRTRTGGRGGQRVRAKGTD